LYCILGAAGSFGQGNWLRSIGDNNNEEIKDAILDSNGDLVMAGFFSNSINTGVGTLNSSGNTDIIVIKTDDAGDPIWAVKAGGTGVDRANSVAEDAAGNTYITGYFQSSATFGSINVTGGGWEAYAAKIDAAGTFVWVTTFGGTFGDIGHGIDVDASGNVFCVGEYKGTATFGADILTSQNNSYDVFITKLDNNGNFLWTRDGNADQDDRALEVTTGANGACYVIGQFSENITFDNLHTSTLLNAGFIVSYDAAGNELWFDQLWGGQILLADIEWGANQVFVTGDFQDNLLIEDLNNVNNYTAQSQYNIFTARFSENGDLNWLSDNFSSSELHATQLTLDASNSAYITGDFNCTFDEMHDIYGNSTFLSVGYEDIHYIKYNASGAFQWARQIASNNEDHCSSITIKNIDKPILAGYHESTLYVPAGTGFTFAAGQQQLLGGTNCADANYGNFASESNSGQRDIFWTSPFDISRLPFDYYEKDPSLSCDLLTYEPCIGTQIVFNDCLDTLEGCAPLTAQLHDHFIGSAHPNYNVSWSSGGAGNTTTFDSDGYYTATTTTLDQCYSWLDSIYISLFPSPDPPLISDSWDFNDNNGVTNPIDSCDADSVLIWAAPSGNSTDTIVWVGNQNELNDSTIIVSFSGTYDVYVINEFGCVSDGNSIDVVINNFALHDTLDPSIVFNDGNIQQTDSTLACTLPFCVQTNLIDSAFTNQWGTLPNLYSVWYIDGVYFDTLFHNSDDTVLVQSPSNIDICVGDIGWHEITAELVNECGDTVFYTIVDSFYVDTIPPPLIDVFGPASACPGDTITIFATYNTTDILWTGNGIIANFQDSVHAVVSSQAGLNVSASVDTTVMGITCGNGDNYYIPPIPIPQVTVDPIDGVVCPNDSVMFQVDGGVSWQWIGPTGDSLGTNQIQYGTDIGEFFCYVTTIDGCVVASEFESTVAYSSPSLYLWDPIICVDDSALIQVLGPSNTVINWLPPLSGSNFQEYATTSGWYYCETTFCGITKVDSVVVNISLPLSGFSMPNDTIICPYDAVTINAPPNFAEYLWNGIPGSDTYVTPDSGLYYLNVTDTNGCTDFSDTLLVEYHQLPSPPVALDTTVCPNGDATLTTAGAGIVNWYTNTGNFIQTGNPYQVNNNTAASAYLVTLTDAFCESVPDTATITIFQDNVVADFIILDDCGSLDIVAQNTGSPGLTYSWDMGDLTTLTGSTINHTYPGTGTYTITLTTTDPICGFSDVTANEVTVYGQIINVLFNVPTCYLFSDGSLTLNLGNSEGTETFLIEDAAGNILNLGGTNTANNLNEGWYYWEVNLGPGCTVVDSTFIDDPDALDAAITLYHPLCAGLTGQATADTVYNWQGNYDEISFIWNPNPGNVGGIAADSAFNMLAGPYVLTINDGNGCSNLIDFTITEPDPLEFNQLGTDPAYCRLYGYQSGNGVVFAAATGGTPDYDYLWVNLGTGDSTTNTTWGGLNPGEYTIQVTDDNECLLTEFVTLDSLNPLADYDMSSPGFVIEWEGDSPLEVHFENQSAYFANPNNPNADTTFFWNFDFDTAPWVISHDVNETFDTVYTAGVYTICLTALNKNGCSDTLCQDLIVYDPVELEPPNIFTPNGDGNNDEFTFLYKTVGVETFRCVVVNRWGVTIREFNDVHDSWDGTDKSGDESQDGVYFYVYEGAGFNGDQFSGQGTVTLIRGNQ
jgi:gliding motility-associated-like protein